MLQVKLTIIGIVLVLLMLVAFQNAENTMLQFFFWETEMPLVAILLGVSALAFGAGYLVGRVQSRLKRKSTA